MKILTVDIGTGTQDIFLYDSRLDLENGFKLVLPSPTMIVRKRLQQATRSRLPVYLDGVIMGGGPSHWAAEDHIRAGLPLYATPDAARSFNDDLNVVKQMGVEIITEDEAARLPSDVINLTMRDFDFNSIVKVFQDYSVSLDDLAAVAVAVFDHGNAPPNVSDRQFRFDYLDSRIRAENRLSAFAYQAEQIPPIMTRLQAVADTMQEVDLPLVVMDTAPAAVLGATMDTFVSAREQVLVANVGNFHTLAFRLGADGIEGVFEHHTGLIDLDKLEKLLLSLADSSLSHEMVFGDHGHGALIYHSDSLNLAEGPFGVAVTGPRRNLLWHSVLRPYFAVPFGDMMLTGCFGLLAAAADVLPEISEPVKASLKRGGSLGTPPWELN
ncbi:MAG: pyruvate formate lyase-activating protein [Anaerolineales bacterium]|nr:pyruvate formate lyase-activating protein [Anaerolineales bacterium]